MPVWTRETVNDFENLQLTYPRVTKTNVKKEDDLKNLLNQRTGPRRHSSSIVWLRTVTSVCAGHLAPVRIPLQLTQRNSKQALKTKKSLPGKTRKGLFIGF
jgi:hypothetical protein